MADDMKPEGWRFPPAPCTASLQHALSLLEGRWKLAILVQLFAQSPMRFSELRRAIPAASEKMLTQQLRALEQDGLIDRRVYAQVPPKVEYRLTELGAAFRPVSLALLDWSARYYAAQQTQAAAGSG